MSGSVLVSYRRCNQTVPKMGCQTNEPPMVPAASLPEMSALGTVAVIVTVVVLPVAVVAVSALAVATPVSVSTWHHRALAR